MNTAFLAQNVSEIREKVSTISGIEYLHLDVSKLGPTHSVFIKVSLDSIESWECGIYHNSRYSIFSIHQYGLDVKIEQISRHHQTQKFRKCKIKSIDDLVNKISVWMNKN